MAMGTRFVTAAILTAVLGAASPAEAAHVKRRPCSERRGPTVAATSQVRVQRYTSPSTGLEAVYACHLRTKVATFLGNDYSTPEGDVYEFGPVSVAGRFVAWAQTNFYGHTSAYFSIRTIDTRSGKVVRSWRVPRGPDYCESYDARNVVVNDRGSMAWTVSHYKCAPTGSYTTYEVWRSESRSTKVQLDFGQDLDPKSLTLDGNTLSWVRGEQTYTASLT